MEGNLLRTLAYLPPHPPSISSFVSSVLSTNRPPVDKLGFLSALLVIHFRVILTSPEF